MDDKKLFLEPFEIQSLNVESLNVEELERRLELMTGVPVEAGWVCSCDGNCPNNCGCNGYTCTTNCGCYDYTCTTYCGTDCTTDCNGYCNGLEIMS